MQMQPQGRSTSIHLDLPKSVLYGNSGLPSSGCPNCPTHHCLGFHRLGFHRLGFHSQCCELGSEGLEKFTHKKNTNQPSPPNKNPPPQILEDLKVEFSTQTHLLERWDKKTWGKWVVRSLSKRHAPGRDARLKGTGQDVWGVWGERDLSLFISLNKY